MWKRQKGGQVGSQQLDSRTWVVDIMAKRSDGQHKHLERRAELAGLLHRGKTLRAALHKRTLIRTAGARERALAERARERDSARMRQGVPAGAAHRRLEEVRQRLQHVHRVAEVVVRIQVVPDRKKNRKKNRELIRATRADIPSCVRIPSEYQRHRFVSQRPRRTHIFDTSTMNIQSVSGLQKPLRTTPRWSKMAKA